MCNSVTPVALPKLVQYVIDDVIPNKNYAALNYVFLAIIGLYVVRGCISFVLNYLIGWLGQRVVFDLRFQSYRHLNRLSLSYYDTRQTGKIMARLMGDIDFIQQMVSGGFVQFLADVFSMFAVLIVLFRMEWRLALIATAVVPLYFLDYKLFIRKIPPLSRQLREKGDAVLGGFPWEFAAI